MHNDRALQRALDQGGTEVTAPTSYTTEEISKLLKISKLTVYDLIKKGELPAYRVGKQMRVDEADLEAYKTKAKRAQLPSAPTLLSVPADVPSRPASAAQRTIVITGQDVSLDLLARQLEKETPGIRALRSYAGSLDSLVAMYRGESDVVSTHLLDGDTGQYNLPYIRRLLGGRAYLVVHLLSRQAGLYVRSGNPLGLSRWSDLGKPGLRLANREIGSGARVLLDEQLRLGGIPPQRIIGYEQCESNHIGVAGKVASGAADVGVGAEKAARLVGGVEFIPLIQERYDLVMLKTPDNREWIEAVLRIVRSDAFKEELGVIGGYNLSGTGDILLET